MHCCLQERGVDSVAVDAAPPPQQAAVPVKASRPALASTGIQPAADQVCTTTCQTCKEWEREDS